MGTLLSGYAKEPLVCPSEKAEAQEPLVCPSEKTEATSQPAVEDLGAQCCMRQILPNTALPNIVERHYNCPSLGLQDVHRRLRNLRHYLLFGRRRLEARLFKRDESVFSQSFL